MVSICVNSVFIVREYVFLSFSLSVCVYVYDLCVCVYIYIYELCAYVVHASEEYQ